MAWTKEKRAKNTKGYLESTGIKECSKCGLYKPLSEFYKTNKLKSGYSSFCKWCNNEYRRNKPDCRKLEYQRLLEKDPDYNKKHYQKVVERNPDHNKIQYQKYKERYKDKKRIYQSEHYPEIKKYHSKWRNKNRDYLRSLSHKEREEISDNYIFSLIQTRFPGLKTNDIRRNFNFDTYRTNLIITRLYKQVLTKIKES